MAAGTSEWSAVEIQQACEIARRLDLVAPTCEQPHYSMMHRERFEVEYATAFKREAIGSSAY